MFLLPSPVGGVSCSPVKSWKQDLYMCDVFKLRDMLEFRKQLSFNIIWCLIYTITDVNETYLSICNETILLSYLFVTWA